MINMPTIIEAKSLLGIEPVGPLERMNKLIERLNARLVYARSQGASCIVLNAKDGFTLFHADGQKKRLPEHVIGALRALDEAGYVFVKDTTPDTLPSLRVYFGLAPATDRVAFFELERWALVEE